MEKIRIKQQKHQRPLFRPAMTRHKRISEIDLAKAIAIILVVLGHITLRSKPENNEWYFLLRRVIYSFHMPLFMYISGFLTLYTYREISSIHEYFTYAKAKFTRLIPAYILFATIILFGKNIMVGYMHVDNIDNNLFHSMVQFLIKPTNSVASNLWYIYVLFIYRMAVPILFILGGIIGISKKNMLILTCVAGFVFHIYPDEKITDYFAMQTVREYIFIFSLGMLSSLYWTQLERLTSQYTVLFTLIFICSIILVFLDIPYIYTKLVVGLCSVPFIIGLTQTSFIRNSKLLMVISKATFAIYLMNTIAIGVVKGLAIKYGYWDGQVFLITAPVLFSAGLFLPIFIKTHIFPFVPVVDKITN